MDNPTAHLKNAVKRIPKNGPYPLKVIMRIAGKLDEVTASFIIQPDLQKPSAVFCVLVADGCDLNRY